MPPKPSTDEWPPLIKAVEHADFTLMVPNNVSMARDQLANERNWLTWFRLSCTLIVLGLTIILDFRLPSAPDDSSDDSSPVGQPFGYIFVAIGIIGCLFGLGKFLQVQHRLARQQLDLETGWMGVIILGIVFCFICSVILVISLQGSLSSGGR